MPFDRVCISFIMLKLLLIPGTCSSSLFYICEGMAMIEIVQRSFDDDISYKGNRSGGRMDRTTKMAIIYK